MTATAAAIGRPHSSEYAPYYERYIALVPASDVLAALQTQLEQTVGLLNSVGEAAGDYRYAPGKWTVKQLIGHLSDAERIFAYRALRIARNDRTPIEGFEQDDYVREGRFEHCRLKDLVDEFAAVRRATLALLASLDEEAWKRRGIANKAEISVRALAYIMAGHELHHRCVLREKYRIG